ncbi:MAG: CHAD domain-containing protein [Acidobacteriota bacterium]|nr:CHAD domain-containing protein [Acidobacteriota bacterium]
MAPSALSVAILRQRLISLLAAMPAAQSGDETSVHQARVASRRLRGALPMLGASADADALDRVHRRVRRITRALGPVRELDVSLQLLTELEGRGVAPAAAIGRVREAVTAERLKRRRDMLDEITPSRLDKLRKRLVDVAAPETRSGVPGDAVAHALAQAGKRARRLRAAIIRAGGIYLAERLHRVRIEAKKLRYALEIQRELARSRSRLHLNRLKTQQDLLGRMHDLEILIESTRTVQASLPARNRRSMAELDALIRVLEDECREGHAAYMHARPSLLKLCESVVDSAGQFRATAA